MASKTHYRTLVGSPSPYMMEKEWFCVQLRDVEDESDLPASHTGIYIPLSLGGSSAAWAQAGTVVELKSEVWMSMYRAW